MAQTNNGHLLREQFSLIRKNGAGTVVVAQWGDEVEEGVEATQVLDITTGIVTDTVTFTLDGSAFSGSTVVDARVLVHKMEVSSDIILTVT